jgi:hypothetical protein
LLAGLPRDIRLAAFAAIVVLVAAAYEISPVVAVLLMLALAGTFVALVVGRD